MSLSTTCPISLVLVRGCSISLFYTDGSRALLWNASSAEQAQRDAACAAATHRCRLACARN